MSPTVFRVKRYRFFFFSLEEKRMHVHVTCPDGEAKFWLTPAVAAHQSFGLSAKQLRELQRIVEERRDEIIDAWNAHFKS